MEKIWKGMTGWQDVVELIVAAWIFVSPVALGFFSPSAAMFVAMGVGVIAALSSQLGIARQQPKTEWFTMGLAVFFMVSPWLFGYSGIEAATLNAVMSGGILFTFALLSLIHEYSEVRKLHT